jgi:hypothetical protein
VAFAF